MKVTKFDMKKIIGIMMIFILAASAVSAQNSKKIKIDQAQLDSIKNEAVRLDSLVKAREAQIGLLGQKLDSMVNVVSESHHNLLEQEILQRDSIINVRNSEIKVLRDREGFVDTCMVKLLDQWLYVKEFNREKIKHIKSFFDQIYSTQIKQQMSVVQELVYSYEEAYITLQKILHEAQNNEMRTSLKFLMFPERFRDKYLAAIKEMPYYQRFYNNEWNIAYMNYLIDTAISILNNHCEEKPADFSMILDSLALEYESNKK